MPKLLMVCFGLLMLLPNGAVAAPVLDVVTLTDYPPVSFVKEGVDLPEGGDELVMPSEDSNYVQGLAWDILRAAFASQGYAIRLHFVPWSRGLMLARNGQIDLLVAVQRHPRREQFLLYSKTPVNRVRYVLYVNGAADSAPRGSMAFASQQIGVMRSWNYGDALDRLGAERVAVDTIDQGFDLLASSRIDALAGYEKVFDYVLRHRGGDQAFSKEMMFGEALEFLAAPRNRRGAVEALNAFERGYEEIRSAGALGEILRRWQSDE